MDFFPMLATGLVTSVHCVAMCGTLVLTYTVKDGSEGTWGQRLATHATYQGAKILSYMLVGLVLGLIGSAVDIGGVRGWVTIAAGAFMILLGLNLTGAFPWLNNLVPKPPKTLIRAVASTRKRAQSEVGQSGMHLMTPLIFGLLTGLMPCGPLQAAQLYAAGTGSPVRGLVAMLGFGLGTAPLMIAFGTVSGMLSGAFKKRMMVVAAAVVMILGLVMLNRGALLVGSPVTFQTVQEAFVGTPVAGDTTFARAADGVVEIPLVIRETRFEPNTLALPEGEPVRLVVDRQEGNACSDQIAIPALGILEDLAPFATTVVEVPAAEGGRYTLTCGMGMMSGAIIIGATGQASGGPTPAAVMAVLAALLAGSWWLYRRYGGQRRTGETCEKDQGPAGALQASRILGFTPVELLVMAAGIGAAIIAGLLFGGALGY